MRGASSALYLLLVGVAATTALVTLLEFSWRAEVTGYVEEPLVLYGSPESLSLLAASIANTACNAAILNTSGSLVALVEALDKASVIDRSSIDTVEALVNHTNTTLYTATGETYRVEGKWYRVVYGGVKSYTTSNDRPRFIVTLYTRYSAESLIQVGNGVAKAYARINTTTIDNISRPRFDEITLSIILTVNVTYNETMEILGKKALTASPEPPVCKSDSYKVVFRRNSEGEVEIVVEGEYPVLINYLDSSPGKASFKIVFPLEGIVGTEDTAIVTRVTCIDGIGTVSPFVALVKYEAEGG